MKRAGVCMLLILMSFSSAQARSPILLINGIVGASLDVRDTRFSIFDPLGSKCNTFGLSNRVWVAPRLLTCGQYELSLQYNERTGRYSDMPGVTVTVPGFGDTRHVEDLDPVELGDKIDIPVIPYLNRMVSYFVERGYERGKSIRAAPYDWRYAADELQIRGYFDELKGLIETMFRENGNQKVTLVVHSMGGLVSLHFLTGYPGIDQAWKDKYINAWVTLSGAWSGGVAALASTISGKPIEDLMLVSKFLAKYLVPVVTTLESIPWLLPRNSVFRDRPLILTRNKVYTAYDYEDLFNTIGYRNGFETHRRLNLTITPNYPAPNVPTHCFYGVNVDTPEMYIYNTNDLENQPQPDMIVTGDGDGTVNLVSSLVCQRWASMRRYPFTSRECDQVSHIEMVRDDQVIEDVAEIVGLRRQRTPGPYCQRVI